MLQPLGRSLIRIVRRVESKVDEERLLLVLVNERTGFVDHEIGKEFAIVKHLFSIPPEVVLVGSTPVEEVGIIIDAPDKVSEGIIEALAVGNGFLVMTEMPLANVRRGVTRLLKFLGDRNLARRHPHRVESHIAIQSTMLGRPPRQEAHARRRAHRSRRIKLRKPHSPLRQPIHVRRDQILRPIAIHVDGPLVISQDDNDVRLSRNQGNCQQ